MTSHIHQFPAEAWKFDCVINTAAFVSEKVLKPGFFIEEVYHDHDGDWQFFHNGGDANTQPRIICLGCICDFDPSILQLHDMPEGWFAYRETIQAPWSRQPYRRTEEED